MQLGPQASLISNAAEVYRCFTTSVEIKWIVLLMIIMLYEETRKNLHERETE